MKHLHSHFGSAARIGVAAQSFTKAMPRGEAQMVGYQAMNQGAYGGYMDIASTAPGGSLIASA